jgi:hypothetical protein
MIRLLCGLLLACGVASPALAQQAGPTPPDKSQYTLFDPTPDALLRDFTTDRPGKSDNPITVDAGHIQIELDGWDYSFDHWSPQRQTTRQVVYGAPELKLGLTSWSEFDAILPVYETLDQRSRVGQGVQRASGQGDLMLGGKANFWGDDGGDTAFGVAGFMKVPTAAAGLGNNRVEFTVNTPFVTALPAQFSLTVEPALGLLREQVKQGYTGDYQMLLNLSRPIIGKAVTAAIELSLDYSSDHNTGTRDTIDPSVQWQLGKNLQLDAGAYVGLTKAAVDYNPYVGISVRY